MTEAGGQRREPPPTPTAETGDLTDNIKMQRSESTGEGLTERRRQRNREREVIVVASYG